MSWYLSNTPFVTWSLSSDSSAPFIIMLFFLPCHNFSYALFWFIIFHSVLFMLHLGTFCCLVFVLANFALLGPSLLLKAIQWFLNFRNYFTTHFIHFIDFIPLFKCSIFSFILSISSFFFNIFNHSTFLLLLFYHFYIYLHAYTLFVPPPPQPPIIPQTPTSRQNLFCLLLLWFC
jgi:hypothetical protein